MSTNPSAAAESKAQREQRRVNDVLRHLRALGPAGLTVAEAKRQGKHVAAAVARGSDASAFALSAEFEHHGTASATLSKLHRAGRIARLSEKRAGAHVYVLPEHIDGRPYQAFVGNREKAQIAALDEAVTGLEALRRDVSPVDRLGIDKATAHLRGMIERLLS